MDEAPAARPAGAAGLPWRLVHALGIAQIVSWGTLYYAFPLFVTPMEAELGWSRTAMNGALTLGLLMAGVGAFPIGLWLDLRGGRWAMTAGSCLGASCLLGWAGVEQLWVLYALWAGIGLAQAATLYEPAFAVVAAAFGRDYRRGITALTLWGGFASTVFVPATQGLIELLGWRGALVALALCNLLLGAAVHWTMLAGTGARAEGPRPPTLPVLRVAMRWPAFWALMVAFTAYAVTFSAMTFHLFPLLIERGVTAATAVAAIALVGPAQVAGRVVVAACGGRLGARGAGRITVLLLPVAIAMLLVPAEGFAWLAAFALVYGAANGVMTIVRSTSVPDLLTRDAYATLNGALAGPAMILKAVAPLGAAVIWSIGGYDAVLQGCLAGAMLSAAAFWLATLLARTLDASRSGLGGS